MDKAVVIGANGLVGNALMHYLDALGTFRNCKDNLVDGRQYEYLDIADKGKVDEFFAAHKPRRVFLAAYNPWVDGCENPVTDKVNVTGVSNVVGNCSLHDCQLIFFSSSYVFDGESQVPYKPKDETYPVQRYGRQKEKAEKEIMNRPDLQWLIIRTVGVFGHEGSPKNFVSQVARAVKEKKKIYVPSDETMNPIWSMDLAAKTVHLSERYSCNIFHVAGDKCLSKYDFAINIAYKLDCKKPHDLVVGMKSAELNASMKRLAVRPLNGCLDCNGLQARAMKVPQFERGLKTFIEQEFRKKSD